MKNERSDEEMRGFPTNETHLHSPPLRTHTLCLILERFERPSFRYPSGDFISCERYRSNADIFAARQDDNHYVNIEYGSLGYFVSVR
jgi:hypothetical protein